MPKDRHWKMGEVVYVCDNLGYEPERATILNIGLSGKMTIRVQEDGRRVLLDKDSLYVQRNERAARICTYFVLHRLAVKTRVRSQKLRTLSDDYARRASAIWKALSPTAEPGSS